KRNEKSIDTSKRLVCLGLVLILLSMPLSFGGEELSISQGAKGAAGVTISIAPPTGSDGAFVEGTMISLYLNINSPSQMEANLSAFAYMTGMDMYQETGPGQGFGIWDQSVTLKAGTTQVEAIFPAIYGVDTIVFTGLADGDIIPPTTAYIWVEPAVVLAYTGCSPTEPREGDDVELHFDIVNSLPTSLDSVTVELYRYSFFEGMGPGRMEGDIEADTVSFVSELSIAPGETLPISLPWNDSVWGAHQFSAVLISNSNGMPYTVSGEASLQVADLDENPAPAFLSLAATLLYFPMALVLLALLSSISRKNGHRNR
ncbi:MAG: hypothetical protein KAT70_00295, partial [Thermoplasmata archaeon]|nr:hypothetical protein [Thermoplasmata archaeon]